MDNCQDWPVHADVFTHPSQWLSSRHHIWLDSSPVDMNSEWKEDWQLASVTNSAIAEDPISRQPGRTKNRTYVAEPTSFFMCNSWGLHLLTARLWPTSLFMVTVKPFPHMQSFHVQVGLTDVKTLRPWTILWTPVRRSANQVWRRSNDSTRSCKTMLSTGWILWRLQHSRNNNMGTGTEQPL